MFLDLEDSYHALEWFWEDDVPDTIASIAISSTEKAKDRNINLIVPSSSPPVTAEI